MLRPADRAILAACLQPQALGPQASLAVTALIASPDALLALASSQLVLPALYPGIQKHDLPPLSPDLAASLSAITELNRERNQLLLSEACRVIALVNGVGVEPIPLKGLAYLLAGIFADSAERYLGDLDFLVPEFQLRTAVSALANAGYISISSSIDPIVELRHHAPAMARQGHVSVELHRSIALGLPSSILPAHEIIRESRPITVPDHPDLNLSLPCPEHLVTHLIIHSQITNVYSERIFPPLRALHDLACLARRYSLDWCAIERRFRAHGQLTTLKLHLLQLQRDFGFRPPILISLTRFEKLRWLRRRILNRQPLLRFFDPTYLFLTAFRRRFRVLRAIVTAPGGLRSTFRTLCKPAFYRRLWDDLVH